ncbi:MAG TPA: dethiobiotin synthetase [Actinomycetes bacterium]|nr:dethiobiotin synthetase [Actinomycetes bacterium]
MGDEGVYVAVVGPSEAADDVLEAAFEVGRLLALAGVTVLTGGLGGVMAAAASGAAEGGGTVVGVLPGTDRAVAHPRLTVALATGLGELRGGLLVRGADAVICVGGSWGTLAEVALARRTGVPLVCLRGWRVLDADGVEQELVHAATADEAVATCLAAARPA